MPNAIKPVDDIIISAEAIRRLIQELGYRLKSLVVLIAVFVVAAILVYGTTSSTYTARAIIGPTRSLVSDTSSQSSGMASKLLGSLSGGQSSTNGNYQEFIQILQSVRLAKALVERDHFLQILYPGGWDEKGQRLGRPSAVRQIIDRAKRVLLRPGNTPTGVDVVYNFLESNVDVEQASPGAKSILSGSSGYNKVTLSYGNPAEAQRILSIILNEADRLIREDLAKDVSFRLIFLQNKLQATMASDQREAVIGILSSQQQMQMMVNADQHIAFNPIEPPYAAPIPVKPSGILMYIFLAILISGFVWAAAVLLSTKLASFYSLLDFIEWRPADAAFHRDSE